MTEDNKYGFELKPAKREAVPALIALWGGTGAGKTYSALLLARGMVGPNGKIAVIDTENKRALFYSDVGAPWEHLDLQPFFGPEKYMAALKFVQDKGAQAVIIDSASHVWEGEGGILDIADNARSAAGKPLQGQLKWKDPKLKHKRMMNAFCRAPINMIFCLRQKDIMKTVKNGNMETYVFDKHVPIAEKNFIFEMTVALRMRGDGYYDGPNPNEQADKQVYYKVPEGLKSIVPVGGRVDIAMGERIVQWLASGDKRNDALINLIARGQNEAYKGSAQYKTFFESLSAPEKKQILPRHDDFKETALQADEESQREIDEQNAANAFSTPQSAFNTTPTE